MNDAIVQSAPEARFKGQILKRVYRVWLVRKWLPIFAAEVVILAVLFYRLGKIVFIQRVLENALEVLFIDPAAVFGFFASAFGNAALGTKVLSIGAVVLLALVVRHITQGMLRLFLVRQNFFSSAQRVRN